MDKNFSVGGGRALSLFAAGKDECGHACGHPERIGVNRAFNSSHAIDNPEPSAYRSSWRVNQELNGFMAHGVEIEKQRGDCFGDHVIDRVGEKDDSLLIKFACLPISALRRSSSSSAMRNLSPIMVSFQVEA